MENLIPLINKVQDAFTAVGLPLMLDLPQIAVVGGQSAGKSSVLENFVGRDFLPRGSGIVTRRPLVLQLVTNTTDSLEYGEFVHKKGQRFDNFDAIRQEIEDETDRVTGSNKGISDIPINLRIYSPNVVNITLIDLPGLTKIPVGDQPKDIEKQIRDMITQFISKDTCLILAVTPGNTDLATSDALNLAKSVDPEGNRTIGVLTKLDLLGEGTDAKAVLENRLLPLKRGYIGVVNRSQKDIDSKKNIEVAVQKEAEFFQKHPAYANMADRLGSPHLQRVLNQQLTNHIKETLPSLKQRIQKIMVSMDEDANKYLNSGAPTDPGHATKILMQLLQTLQQDFERSIDGQSSGNNNTRIQVNMMELSAGVKINRIFHERFPYDIVKSTEMNEAKLRNEIGFAIRNVHAIRTGLFTPNKAFEVVIRQQIERLKEPSFKCLDLVVQEINKVAKRCTDEMSKYPALRGGADHIIGEFVNQAAAECRNQINFIIECELAYINMNHDDFQELTNGTGSAKNSVSAKGLDVGNEIIRKGYMYITNAGLFSRSFWFALTANSFSWYKDGDEQEKKFMMSLDELKLRDNVAKSRQTFQLYNTNGRNIYKDFKVLELTCESQEEADFWRASFLRVGVHPTTDEEKQDEMNHAKSSSASPQLDRQIETIRSLLSAYMKIVVKTCRDIVPKTIMHLLISRIKNFIYSDLTAQLYANTAGDIMGFMAESQEEAAKREEFMKQYTACKQAMNVVSDVAISANSMNLMNRKPMYLATPQSTITPSHSSHSLNALYGATQSSGGLTPYTTPPITRHSRTVPPPPPSRPIPPVPPPRKGLIPSPNPPATNLSDLLM